MNTEKNNSLAPFLILTFIYFIVGFMTTVNGQLQGPLKITFLADATGLKNTLTTCISFFFFSGYLINSRLGGKWINTRGYKTTLVRSLVIMISGLLMYFLSSLFVVYYGDAGIKILSDNIPYGYFIFLAGAFLMGTSAAILQVVINPYIAAYAVRGTQPVQRMNIVCAVNSFGTTIAPFFVTGVMLAGIALDDVQASQLIVPFMAMALFVTLTALISNRLYLPDLQGTRAEEGEKLEQSVWSFRHFALGAVAIFFYVGAEVSIGVNVNLHAMEMGSNPAPLATLYWGGLMAGRIISSFLSKISPRVQLLIGTILAAVLTLIAVFTNNLWVLVSVGLCHSVMWGCIFTLSIQGLKKYTSKASGTFMMGVFGGAVFPLLQGLLADVTGSWQWTWLIVVVCELVMLFYALWGSQVKTTLI
jgi:FHS family L-fucose permease-like MFS transporter